MTENNDWIYLSDEIILKNFTYEEGKDAIPHFYRRILLKHPYNEGVDYQEVSKMHELVQLYCGEEEDEKHFGNRRKFYIVSKRTYDDLIARRKYKVKVSSPEKIIADKLAVELNGRREVYIDGNKRIDILSDTEIIEVKKYKNMLSAVGQILYYSEFYPNRTRRIHLYEHGNKRDRKFENMCRALNIILTYEHEVNDEVEMEEVKDEANVNNTCEDMKVVNDDGCKETKEEIVNFSEETNEEIQEMKRKPCSVCEEVKDFSEFKTALEHRDGKENTCKVCRNKQRKERMDKKKAELKIKPTEKECYSCHETVNIEKCCKDSSKLDGYKNLCLECHKKAQKNRKQTKIIEEKKCNTCNEVKLVSEYHKSSSSSDGYNHKCKACRKETGT
jgi:hypothetical protein